VHPQEGYLSRQREPLPTHVRDLPPLPSQYHAVLHTALPQLGLSLDGHIRAAIDAHIRLLLRWTEAINLTAIRDPAEVARLHVADSLSAVLPLREAGIDRFVDLGSGGGFPGLPLALALPARRAVLVESVGKKASFLESAVGVTGTAGRVEVARMRAEAFAARPAERGTWPAVTARAVADLAELVELAFPLLRREGRLVAWKRGALDIELETARQAVEAAGGGTIEIVEAPAELLPGHLLVTVTKHGVTPARLPRDPAERRRRPW
jgi:16S rRNA (guanine527-N7)-methyltransferase